MTLTQNRPAPGTVSIEERKARPVIGWAVVGVIFLSIQAYSVIGWILSGPERTPAGPTPAPGWMKAVVLIAQIVSPILLCVFVYLFVVRPWRRDKRLSADGIMCLVCGTLWWQDSLVNYFGHWYTANALMFNFGAWDAHVPGWMSPNGGRIVEGLLFAAPAYVWVVFGLMVFGCAILRRVKTRYPAMGKTGIFATAIGMFIAFDFVVEPFFMRLGLFAYPGAIREVSLFAGKYYQFPIYEAVFWGTTWGIFTAIRFLRDDRGLTFAERGVEQVKASPKQRTVLRFLAQAGLFNAIFIAYNIPASIVGLYSDPWPADLVKRSYLTNTLCGPGTDYHCPEPAIPIPRRTSSHVGPDGSLVEPD